MTINAGATVKLGNDLNVTGESLTYSLTISGAGSEFIEILCQSDGHNYLILMEILNYQ